MNVVLNSVLNADLERNGIQSGLILPGHHYHADQLYPVSVLHHPAPTVRQRRDPVPGHLFRSSGFVLRVGHSGGQLKDHRLARRAQLL